MKPNFFIAGTPKSGTTSLFHYLDEHPEVFMCPIKEPNFFSCDQIVMQQLYYKKKDITRKDDYEKLFQNVRTEIAIGEASVSYLFYDKVPARIKTTVPDAKIIIILRDPADRAFSHYLMDSRLGYVDLTFEDIVYQRTDHRLGALYYHQFVELGLYYEQVKRYLDIFGTDQVKIFINEDLREDMTKVILDVYDFLQIDPTLMPDLDKQYNVYQKPRNSVVKALYSAQTIRRMARAIIPNGLVDRVKDTLLVRAEKPQIASGAKKYLNDLFKENMSQTGELIGRDLSHWCGE